MFDDIIDHNERHYALNYYLYLVGWYDDAIALAPAITSERAEELRSIAKAEALAWVTRRYTGGRCRIIPWPSASNEE